MGGGKSAMIGHMHHSPDSGIDTILQSGIKAPTHNKGLSFNVNNLN